MSAAAAEGSRSASVEDVHEIARSLPGVTVSQAGPTVYEVSRRSFLFFRNPRPDAVDPRTGERYTDVIVFWVESELVCGGDCRPGRLSAARIDRPPCGAARA